MDSGVIVSSPSSSSSNNSKMRQKVRNNLPRNSKTKLSFSKSNTNNHKNNKNHVTRSNSLRSSNNKHINNINKINTINKNNINNGNTSQHDLSDFCFGEFTREVYNAICLRLGHTLHIPEDSLQALFNDMQLYPSAEQLAAMIQCARQCSRRNGAQNKYVTFGEFCLFVREMQNQPSKQYRKIQQANKINNKCTDNCEVFLGGSCNPTTWRADTAIPELQKHGITFYNPQVPTWAPELVEREHVAKQSANVLLYVVDSQTRSTVGMIEVAYLVSSGRCVVLVVHPYRSGQTIMNETISNREYVDLVEAQTTLLTLVKARGLKVYSSLQEALQCTANILKVSSNNGITTEEQVAFKLRKLREVFDSYGGQKGEINFFDVIGAYQKLTNQTLKIQDLYKYASENTTNKNISNTRISFEKFCALMAEFTTDNCSMFQNDVWASQSLQLQSSMNNNVLIDCNNTCIYDSTQVRNFSSYPTYNVFLGGSTCSQDNWREDIAIPLLKKYGITYYNPALREDVDLVLDSDIMSSDNNCVHDDYNQTTDEDVLQWKKNMDKSEVLLFVVGNDTRSLTTMILAGYHIGEGCKVVLCIQDLPVENCRIYNETLTEQAVKDYNRGRVYLADYARKRKTPVFNNITETMQYIVNKFSDR